MVAEFHRAVLEPMYCSPLSINVIATSYTSFCFSCCFTFCGVFFICLLSFFFSRTTFVTIYFKKSFICACQWHGTVSMSNWNEAQVSLIFVCIRTLFCISYFSCLCRNASRDDGNGCLVSTKLHFFVLLFYVLFSAY